MSATTPGIQMTVQHMPLTGDISLENVSDIEFSKPYIDVDEWREGPARHRYLHGGWRGNKTRFSFYFPCPTNFDGLFFQHAGQVEESRDPALESADAQDAIYRAVDNGAYLVETHSGGPGIADTLPGSAPFDGCHRSNAAAAGLSRDLAREVFGHNQRPSGFLYGSSHAHRAMDVCEHAKGAWDGFVYYEQGTLMAIPKVYVHRSLVTL